MGSFLNIGKKAGEALGGSLFTAANQLFYSSASGQAAVLAAPSLSGQRLEFDGSNVAWSTVGTVQTKVVASNVNKTNNTLGDITGLTVPISTSATEVWFFEAYLAMTAANTTMDMKFGMTVPTSTTALWGPIAATTAGGFTQVQSAGGTAIAALDQTGTQTFASGNNTVLISLGGFIYGGATAGNVQLQFAQNTTDASNLTVKAGSMLRATKLVV